MTNNAKIFVYFPAVGARSRIKMLHVRIERLPGEEFKRRDFVNTSAGRDENRILDDSRSGEPANTRFDQVMVRYSNPSFTGPSFGLALGLADKLLRHGPSSTRRVVATGMIKDGEDGLIGCVGEFDIKAPAVIAYAQEERNGGHVTEPIIFAFPEAEWQQAPSDVRDLLEEAVEQEILVLRLANHISDLANLWNEPPSEVERKEEGSTLVSVLPLEDGAPRVRWWQRWYAKIVLGAAALLILAIFAGWTVRRPTLRCEAALRAMDPPGRPDHQRIAAAVVACDAPARRNPADGRLLFLAGQAHQLAAIFGHDGGSVAIARRFWQASARARDPDGLATWGRVMWLESRCDETKMASSVRLLEAATAAKSAAAASTLAEIHATGCGVEPNMARASALLAQALDWAKEHE